MLLAIDIGNTDTVIGLFEAHKLKRDFRIASAHNLTTDEAGLFITGLLEKFDIPVDQIRAVIVSSVVPHLTPVYEAMSGKFFDLEPLVVTPKIKLPIKIEIDHPEEVGADRIANAVAGIALYGGPVIIVDFGTATTFDVVNENGAYIGGVIIPGPITSMAELARKAARLFEVKFEKPDRIVGRSTNGALKSGLFHGQVGQVEYLLGKIIDETGFKAPKIVATGGLAGLISDATASITLTNPTLTLEGLRLIAEFQS